MSEENQTRLVLISIFAIFISIYLSWTDKSLFILLKNPYLVENTGFFTKLISTILGTFVGIIGGFIGILIGNFVGIIGNINPIVTRFLGGIVCSSIGAMLPIMFIIRFFAG